MAKKSNYVYDWPRPMVTVDALVFYVEKEMLQVLLIKRANEPFKNKWAIPGGFVEMEEELIDAANRELYEETGLKDINLQQLHTFGTCGRDPRGRQITIVFFGVTSKKSDIKGDDDAAEAKWFDLRDIPKNLAFDHDQILKFALLRLTQNR